jgi:hypothetical protein
MITADTGGSPLRVAKKFVNAIGANLVGTLLSIELMSRGSQLPALLRI